MKTTTTVSISAEYSTLLRQYSELSGISAKAAAEYAIDHVLVPEIEEYFQSSGAPEEARLMSAANALLPESWRLNIAAFGVERTEVLVGLDLGLGEIIPTYVTIDEAEAVRRSLYDMPTSGGSFCIGGTHLGKPVYVRRQGQGILFQAINIASGKPTGPRTTIASRSAYRIAMALDLAICAARKQDEAAS
ncbi:hypothetical protein K3758_15150 [Sulfitobacter sp. W002]|uniref:hypothetical protein n=1 Tax=Sulfitobacter sp. W002 TaxID=2867024 RepID=UPI0021A3C648|nr:hypothetical protein [Sulfitobacter sp. W002]UWR29661.1 hypothetical protein K3758_15150 [Sulfitobacter sp. W002]